MAIYDIYEAHKLYESYKLSKDSSNQGQITPATNPNIYEPVRGTPAKRNKITSEIWEKDKSRHGGDHYEVYKNKRDWENRKRDRAVDSNGKTIRRY